MRVLLTILVCLCLFAGIAAAAQIDGKWMSERTTQRGTMKQTFDLKADGDKLSGKVEMVFGEMEPRTTEIKDGKIDGNKFSFSTTMSTPNGDFKTVYSGTVEGDTLKGTAQRGEGEPRPFEAKRVK